MQTTAIIGRNAIATTNTGHRLVFDIMMSGRLNWGLIGGREPHSTRLANHGRRCSQRPQLIAASATVVLIVVVFANACISWWQRQQSVEHSHNE